MIDAELDILTNSIVNRLSGDVFDTVVVPATDKDLRRASKRNGWAFDWKKQDGKGTVYKLLIADSEVAVIQGLVCIEDKGEHIHLALAESAPFNKGKDKVYLGVAGNLFAFACKVSRDKGYEGFVAFTAKTALVKHYESTLGAKVYIPPNIMVINPPEADKLISQYFKY